jgi:hypothetical protein
LAFTSSREVEKSRVEEPDNPIGASGNNKYDIAG